MTLLLIPISLLGILLITSLLYSIAGLAAPIHYDIQSQQPLSPIAGFYLAEWTSSADIRPSVSEPLLKRRHDTPIRVKLHWRSCSMSALPDRKSSIVGNGVEPTARAMKRFSVQLPLAHNDSNEIRKPLVESPKEASPTEVPEKIEPGNFLVALAAQERRVLELKEELQKAETDLTKLKRQWAHHEAIRKRQEIRQQAEPMRSMKTINSDSSMAQEMKSASEQAKRRSVVLKAKQSQRKVFEGGRHTRTLSLLSPTSLVNRGSLAESIDTSLKTPKVESLPATAIPRVNTPSQERSKSSDPSKEDIVATSKQIMGDLKEGLWTFIEDLRQATVGDEALSTGRARQHDPASGLTHQKTTHSVQNNVVTLAAAPTPRKKSPVPTVTPSVSCVPISRQIEAAKEETLDSSLGGKDVSDDDGWDNWDSPPSKTSGSTFSSPARSTPRSSLSSDTKRQSAAFDQIPWPALQKLPGNLTRTASNLMKEWEKSLNSPSEEMKAIEWPIPEPRS